MTTSDERPFFRTATFWIGTLLMVLFCVFIVYMNRGKSVTSGPGSPSIPYQSTASTPQQ